ncbi:hypothetical protein LCGC14_2773100 [marine sediment metagenome]|uniref:Ribbon-helix-helix protein CopG domain-containing protein n=1 Tax=marine sediment metagenome TaxID=412755 RepID=A0A0F9B494_9ZZZZ
MPDGRNLSVYLSNELINNVDRCVEIKNQGLERILWKRNTIIRQAIEDYIKQCLDRHRDEELQKERIEHAQ